MPSVDRLDAFLNPLILADPGYWWPVKRRAKAALQWSHDPEAFAARMLAILHTRHMGRRQLAA